MRALSPTALQGNQWISILWGLPHHLWHRKTFRVIGEKCRGYIRVDSRSLLMRASMQVMLLGALILIVYLDLWLFGPGRKSTWWESKWRHAGLEKMG